ncbi:hemicentin-1 isoform X1 [Maylandia zebra]|uniref:hemicentin-1 isoform X1 n=1 Tax=Maylandia zebra TaxID=106582 RepID=UPI00403CF35C
MLLKHCSIHLIPSACCPSMLPVRMLSILILLFSLCNADSICTTELKTDPPEIIAEYGGIPVIVNCTTRLGDHYGLYWRVGNESSDTEDEEMFISHLVPVSDWNVTAECKMKFNESYECSKELKVILFNNPEVFHSVQLVNVIGEETQYRLQCDIINVAPVQYVTVSWYKNSEKIQTESFNDTTTKTPVNESSILRVNISREENVVEFRCEAQLDFGPHRPKLPAISKTHRVSAHYAPELKTQNSADDTYALEGTNITLSCEAVGNPLLVYNWICDGKNMLENTTSLSLPQVHGNKTCACTATNYLGNITKTIHLHVEPRGCPLTLTPSETVVKFGDPVAINCSTSARYVEGMGWEAPFGGTGFERPPVVTWRVEKLEEWTPSPSCYATLVDGSQCTVSPVITVYKTPDSVSVSDMGHGSMVEGREYDLKCDIINVAPVQYVTVSWYKNSEKIQTESFNDTTTKTPVNESSILRVNISREENVVEFRCEAQLDFGPHRPKLPAISKTHRVSAHYAPELKTQNSADDTYALEGTNITLSCEAVGNPLPVYNWICDGKNMLENTTSLSLPRVHGNKTCACTATNYLGNITKTIHLHVEPRGCPLTLTPSETVVKFGDPVSINCSTSARYVEGMGWEAPFGGTGFERPPVVTWRVEKLEEWTPSPSCYATLVDGSQCAVSPVITVYKTPNIVSIYPLNQSQMMEEQVHIVPYNKETRTQYWLRCDIINVAPVQHLTVRWYKNNKTIQTESFNDTTTKTLVNESSILRIDISREEKATEFRCEAELDFGPHGLKLPAISQTHRVSAHYAPELKTQNSADDTYALEGTDIILSCEAVGNPLPVYNWICDGKNMLENTTSLSLPRVHGNKTCACTATNYLGNITKTIHLHVEPRGCPLTLTPSETVVKFGDPVSINCSTSVTDVEGMGWEAPFGGTGFERPPVVTWRVEKLEEWTPSPFCYVTLVNGSQRTVSPVITVYKTPDSVSVSDMGHGSMVEGREYDLKCDVINVAPVQNLTVTWYRGNETVKTDTFNDSTMTPVNASSTLRISTPRDYNGLTFRCEAELHLGPKGPKFPPNVTSPPYTAVVLYKPFMESCPDHVTVVENAAFSKSILSCQADGNPPPTVQWFYEGKILNSSKPLTRTDSGKYTAIVENSRGRSNTSVHITVEYSPSFTCKEHYEITVNDKHQSICEPVGLPTPTLTWLKDGKQMVSPQLWKKNDSGKYLLKAHNTHGTAEHTLYLEILYAPEFKEGNESKEVLQGENVTLSCSADSNPPSNITWIYTAAVNSNMTTEGHQKTVTITRATSTNAGYYICVAENKVGRNTRFITLMITGKSSQIPFPIIWVSLTLLIIILILLVVCCRICQKKRGHYSFFPVKVSNVSNIPLTSVQANGKAKDF